MHARVRVDRRNGLLAGDGCSDVAVRTFERFDGVYAAWARSARREVAPDAWSPLCPGKSTPREAALRIGWPHDGARFLIDPERTRAEQAIAIRVEAPSGASVAVRVDGAVVARTGAPFVARWALVPGEHWIEAEGMGARSERVRVVVD